MVKVTYIQADGTEQVADLQPIGSLMEATVKSGIPGIAADCGGACACATCRVYIEPEWQAKIGTPSGIEQPMIEFCEDPDPRVRLSCQVLVTNDLDGLVLWMPASQH